MKILPNTSGVTMFNVKVYDKHPMFVDYNTNPKVAFSTGTANPSRFGQGEEVKYSDVPVKFTFSKAHRPWNR